MGIPFTNTSSFFSSAIGKSVGHSKYSLLTRLYGLKRYIFSIFCILLILSSSVCLSKESNKILILLSGNEDVYLDVATTITNSTIKQCRNIDLDCQDTNFEIIQVGSFSESLDHKYQLIVTLGNKAAIYARNNLTDNTVLSALIPENSSASKSQIVSNKNQHYLFLDQPLHRSLLLIKSLSDHFKSVGVLINIKDDITPGILSKSAEKLNLSLEIENIESTEQIGVSLNSMLLNVDILLAIPDTSIHNKSTVSNILLTAYRNRIPLIGFSSAYVKAGALAAIYSSPEDIAFHVRDNIIDIYSNRNIHNSNQLAKYFTIMFNTDVARSLGFPIKSVTKLKKEIITRSSDDIE